MSSLCLSLSHSLFIVTSSPTVLPAPNVSISPARVSPTAGQTYSLTCSVQVVPHLVEEPSIVWTRQDGTQVNVSSGYSLQLYFNPLRTSDGGDYTCQASVNISGVVSVSGEDSIDLLVASECCVVQYLCSLEDCSFSLQYLGLQWSSAEVAVALCMLGLGLC